MNKWISVKDRLPEDRNDVLVYTIWGDMAVYFLDDCDVWMHTWGVFG